MSGPNLYRDTVAPSQVVQQGNQAQALNKKIQKKDELYRSDSVESIQGKLNAKEAKNLHLQKSWIIAIKIGNQLFFFFAIFPKWAFTKALPALVKFTAKALPKIPKLVEKIIVSGGKLAQQVLQKIESGINKLLLTSRNVLMIPIKFVQKLVQTVQTSITKIFEKIEQKGKQIFALIARPFVWASNKINLSGKWVEKQVHLSLEKIATTFQKAATAVQKQVNRIVLPVIQFLELPVRKLKEQFDASLKWVQKVVEQAKNQIQEIVRFVWNLLPQLPQELIKRRFPPIMKWIKKMAKKGKQVVEKIKKTLTNAGFSLMAFLRWLFRKTRDYLEKKSRILYNFWKKRTLTP